MTDASLFEVAVQCHRAGQIARAEHLYRRVLEQTPEHCDAMFLLSVLAVDSGELEQAAALLERAVRVDPNNAFYLSHLGDVYRCLGRKRDAIGVLLMAVARKPDLVEAVLNLARTFEGGGDFAAAAACYERVHALDPKANHAAERLANVRAKRDALAAKRNPAPAPNADSGPRASELFTALGETLRLGGRPEDAVPWYRAALEIDPGMANAHTALGAIHADASRFDDAILCFRRALEIDENFHLARGYLATALDETGRLEEAQATYRDAVARCPNDPIAHSVLLFNLPFWPNITSRDILNEAKVWNTRHAQPLAARAAPLTNDRSPERRLRVGYVSPDFHTHVQSLFTVPLLQNHDHSQFEVFCYSSVEQPTPLTERIRGYADVWREVAGLDDAALAELIRRDQIDILVDLTMHMVGRRLLTFARRPAPIQLCWLAYPGTTGLETMDYRLSDPFLDPADANIDVYSEETLRLPNSFWCYDPLTDEVEVSALPALVEGRITFGCLNHFRKINDAVLRLWAKVLARVPRSRLLLLVPAASARNRVHAIFAECGIERERIEFLDRSGRLDYLHKYRKIDICLDTFPYNGHTTSLDALWMGVPTVTLVGDTVVGRAGLCQAMNVGLPELVANTAEDYLRVASALAENLEHLAEIRGSLRERMKQSPLMDGPRFTRDLEFAYREVWRRLCEER
ncbi:MAG TPA: tetratricopeptide repeat protein [Polyangiaceae bacterium]|nr:tetratricopeptide repeat protein [Polyangiaceae bacterium]